MGLVRANLSFDHLVGEREQLVGYGKAERLGSLEVDDQLELDWGLDGKLARLLALDDAIGICRRLSHPQQSWGTFYVRLGSRAGHSRRVI